jgi:hypothetical protein
MAHVNETLASLVSMWKQFQLSLCYAKTRRKKKKKWRVTDACEKMSPRPLLRKLQGGAGSDVALETKLTYRKIPYGAKKIRENRRNTLLTEQVGSSIRRCPVRISVRTHLLP